MNEPNSAEASAPDSLVSRRSPGSFRAHLQGIGLRDLVVLQNLVRSSGVFLVHGSNNAAKETVARFLERLSTFCEQC